MERWVGRVALVTGASSGIGASLAERLVRKGMKVVGCARRLDKLQELSTKVSDASGSFLPVKCDLQKEDEILAMFDVIKQQYGGVDVCINNAGLARDGVLMNSITEGWRAMWEVNVMALCICTREALKSMTERGVTDGHIIHINSDSGHFVDAAHWLHFYDCTKFAVTALAQGLRMELCASGSKTKVTTLSPAFVRTDIADHQFGRSEAAKIFETTPHMVTDDIADAMEYALGAPPHVQVHDVLLSNVQQTPNTLE